MAATKELAITIKARNEASRVLNQVKGDVNGLSGGLDSLTRSAVKVAAAFVGFQAISREIKAAYKSVVELDTGLRQLWTRLDVGEKQMGGISKAIQDVAIQFGHAASMGVKAVDTIASSGYDAASSFRIYQTAAKAAVASGQAVDTTAAQIAQVMSTYRLAANEVDRVADLLFATKVPLGEIASIVGDIGYEAKALGVPLEELITVLGRMHQEGADVGQLTRIFRQIQGEGKAWLIQQYGLVEGIERYAKSKGDMRQMATIMGLIRAGTGQAADATGALDAAFAKTWGSFQVQTSRVREALTGVWREIVNIFIPGDPAEWADTLVKKLQQVRQWISQNSDALRYFIKMFGELAIVVGLIIGVKAALGLLSNTMFQLTLLGSLVWVAWKVDLFGIREALGKVGEALASVLDGIGEIVEYFTGTNPFENWSTSAKALAVALGAIVAVKLVGWAASTVTAVAAVTGQFAALLPVVLAVTAAIAAYKGYQGMIFGYETGKGAELAPPGSPEYEALTAKFGVPPVAPGTFSQMVDMLTESYQLGAFELAEGFATSPELSEAGLTLGLGFADSPGIFDAGNLLGQEAAKAIAGTMRNAAYVPYQTGGMVPGTGTGDKVPAMLEPGEFIVPRWMMALPWVRELLLRTWRGYAAGGPVASGVSRDGKTLVEVLRIEAPELYKVTGDWLFNFFGTYAKDFEETVRLFRAMNSFVRPLIDQEDAAGEVLSYVNGQAQLLGQNLEYATSTLSTFSQVMVGAAQEVVGIIRSHVSQLVRSFVSSWLGTAKKAQQTTEQIFDSLLSVAIPTGYKLSRAAWGVARPGEPWSRRQMGGLEDTLEDAGNWLLGLLEDLIVWGIMKLFDWLIGKPLEALLDGLFAGIGDLVEGGIGGIFDGIGSFFQGVFKAIYDVISGVLNAIWAVIQGIGNLLMTIVQTVYNIIVGVLQSIFGVMSGIWTSLVAAFGPLVATILVVISVLTALSLIFPEFGRRLWELLQQIGEFFYNILRDFWTLLVNVVSFIGEAVKTIITGIGQFAQSIMKMAWNLIQNILNFLWNGLASLISGIFSLIGGIFGAGGGGGGWSGSGGVVPVITTGAGAAIGFALGGPIGAAIGAAGGWLVSRIFGLASGGMALTEGLAMLHPGEIVMPAKVVQGYSNALSAAGISGGTTINFYGDVILPGVRDPEDFIAWIERKNLRGTGRAYGGYAAAGGVHA